MRTPSNKPLDIDHHGDAGLRALSVYVLAAIADKQLQGR
jgi:hypothetical protein